MRIFRFIWAILKHLFIGGNVANEVYLNRLNYCKECEHRDDQVCSICGCYVDYKTRWASEECPLKKW